MVSETSMGPHERSVEISVGERRLRGIRSCGEVRAGVVFAHGSGSGRLSPRNQFLAQVLLDSGLASLRFDLLEEQEAEDRTKMYDVELLADRVQFAARWVGRVSSWGPCPWVTSARLRAAAVLIAAARRPELVGAVVTRGGHVDLAGVSCPRSQLPTLLIVGEHDTDILEINRQAQALLRGPKVVIPGATHLFPESGALEEGCTARHAMVQSVPASCGPPRLAT